MKKPTVFQALLLSVLLLILLPWLSYAVFRNAAEDYARKQAYAELVGLREGVENILERSFSEDAGGDPVRLFLSQAGSFASRRSGSGELMIFAGENQLIYPRDADARATAEPLAGAFLTAVDDEKIRDVGLVKTGDGTEYLLSVVEPPVSSARIRYIIAWCPAAEVGAWVHDASCLVLAISAVFSLLTLLVLWITARRIASPLRRLCAEAERIGAGDYAPIEAAFSLREPDALRMSMNKMAQELDRAEESQKHFFQNVSHELRNPLMSIGGYAQGIEQNVFSPPEAARTIMEESRRLTELVDSLLTLSRLEAAEKEIRLENVSIRDTAEYALDRLYGQAAQKNVRLALSVELPELTALGDEALLDQVLDNLLSNAVRYAKSEVRVSAKAENGEVRILVTDDGDGVNEQDLPHVFERCWKGRDGHFGLGLAIAKSAAEKMGGRLTAANRPEGGAAFTLVLACSDK